MKRGYVLGVGGLALLLGLVIVGRGILERASILYDLVGVLFVLLGSARLFEAVRGGRR